MSSRAPRPILARLALALTSLLACHPQAAAPVQAPAAGSDWVQAPGESETPAVATTTPKPALLIHAADVDGQLDELIGGARARAEYAADDPWLGADVPLVTIVAYLDYQCPYSQRVVPTLYQLAELHGDDVRVVFKHFPLPMHPAARLAAIAATAAQRQGRFWALHDALFEDQRALDRDSIVQRAGRLGFDLPLFEQTLDDPEVAARIDAEIAEGQRIGVQGTPSLFINGRMLGGARALPELREEVGAEVEIAKRLLDAGAPRESLYAHFMHAAQPEAVAPSPRKPAAIADDVRREVDTQGLPRKGAKHPKVVILECADFDCPFCGRARATLDQLIANHPDDVALFYSHLPLEFHEGAEPAARAAIAAQAQGKFWEMHELLFANTRARSNAALEKLAKTAKLDVKKFRRAFAAEATAARVKAERDTCTAHGIRGTPGFLINGRLVSGARSLDDFEAVIDQELERAR